MGNTTVISLFNYFSQDAVLFHFRAFQQYLSSRLRAQRHLIEEKQERIAIVPDGEVETEIAKELQDKADIAAKLQFPGKRLHFDDMKQTRWFSSAFNDAARMELTDVVNHCFMKLSEVIVVSIKLNDKEISGAILRRIESLQLMS